MGPRLVPVVAAVSSNGLMHLPKAVREGIGLREGEKVVFFVDEKGHSAKIVPESEGFRFPDES